MFDFVLILAIVSFIGFGYMASWPYLKPENLNHKYSLHITMSGGFCFMTITPTLFYIAQELAPTVGG